MHAQHNPSHSICSTRLTDGEVHELLNASDDPRSRALAHLALQAGLPIEEIRQLRWADLDHAAGVAHARGGKTGSRTIALPPQLAAALEAWRSEQEAQARRNPRLAQALASPDTAYLFPARAGGPLSARALATQFAAWSARTCGRAITFHLARCRAIAAGFGRTGR